MEQSENFIFISQQQLQTDKRPRLHNPKTTTAGTCIGPMPLPDLKNYKETWCLSLKDKKAIYGEARIAPYGRFDGDELAGQSDRRASIARRDTDIQPVAYHALHKSLWEELVHQVGGKKRVKCIIDLTPTEPTLATVALEWQ
eukprot:487254-Pyramimonas_sp.AAC.1